MPNSFLFDQNKCVGCMACVLACQFEYQRQTNWRSVIPSLPKAIPGLPLFHISIACNHCKNAPCIKTCPANAIFREEETGAVLVNQNKCIGCKYCTLTCPYDAPKYNQTTKVIEKCNFCYERINDSLLPACVEHCPTGALQFKNIDEDHDLSPAPGFYDKGLQPAMKVIPLNQKHKMPDNSYNHQITNSEKKKLFEKNKPASKINLLYDWNLLLFTLINAVLSGLFFAQGFDPGVLTAPGFLLVGAVSFTIALLHTGKKKRAFRAIFHLKKSWLSREILFFTLFLLSGVFHFFIFPNFWLTAVFALGMLISTDRVYYFAMKKVPVFMHSASVTLTAFTLAAFFTNQYEMFAVLASVKFFLYIYRKIIIAFRNQKQSLLLSILRLITGFAVPVYLWYTNPPKSFILLAVGFIAGELVDRIEFYRELEIMSPPKKMYLDMKNGKI